MTTQAMKQKGALLLAALGAALAGAFMGREACGGWREGVTAKSWPTVQGVVTHQKTLQENRGVRESRDRPKVTAVLGYRYVVDAVEHTGETRRTGLADYEARSWLDTHPVGQAVEAHYDPSQPGESVVDPVFRVRTILFAGGAVLAMLGAVALAASLFMKGGRTAVKTSSGTPTAEN
ncbi:MAG: hypothetical protein BWX88_04070 [Planctomycetes bacterium ADurb.Bin126]|nr:MAG: hypothetical protein BWX88_04070 [Planctomycetes bacterium ADurb.Bin126]HQL75863.1 DUF3592 domain-containing protein [Phycisphaerae bacterium]